MTCQSLVQAVFSGRGQIVFGVIVFVTSVVGWAYGTFLHGEALVRFIFHVSMAALVIGSYSIIAAALAIRTAERVESQVDPNKEAE